jgi:hypothetical protein
MATLSGQTIQSTYKGLLKLADSTTGITDSYQSIEDGLGNNTGMKIKNNFLSQMNQLSIGTLPNNFFGYGFSTGVVAISAGVQNLINGQLFYDSGLYQYSAITFNLNLATTTSDTFECAFYTAQMGPTGVCAKDVIISGITASTTGSLGLKTYVFPNYISFSATPGMNMYLTKYSNSGVTPTVRFNSAAFSITNAYHISNAYGFQINPNGNATSIGIKAAGTGSAVYSGLTTFNATYNASDFSDVLNIGGLNVGFVLHTVK